MKKIALITGSTRGIGRSIAFAYAKRNYVIILHGSKETEESKKLLHEIKRLSPQSAIYYFDCANYNDLILATEKIINKYKRIDVLVNNAGIVRNMLFAKMSLEDFDRVMKVNLYGTFYMCKQVIPLMIKNKWGRVINLSSISASRGEFGQVNYSSSKSAILGFTKSLAKELAKYNITVNAISPGVVDTDILKKVSSEYITKIIESIPLKRMAKTDEIAKLALFLASSESGYITGTNININGGWY